MMVARNLGFTGSAAPLQESQRVSVRRFAHHGVQCFLVADLDDGATAAAHVS
jgi:hypothetical protein